MPLAITDDHRELASVVSDLAEDNDLRAYARAVLSGRAEVAQVWRRIAAQGWLGLHVPEEYGGSGYSLAETAVVIEELGCQLTPAPFLPSVVVSATLAEAGTDDQRKAWLPGIVDGTVTVGAALASTVQVQDGALSGKAVGLLAGSEATLLLVAVGTDAALVETSALGAAVQPHEQFDPALGIATVTLDSVPLERVQFIAGGAGIARRVLRTVAAAEAAGGAQAVLDQALQYSKIREQFGRTIGSFQAIKHTLADMLMRVELAVAVAWDAAGAGTGAQGELAAAAAAELALDAYCDNAQHNIQVHGGIGFTWEHDAHLYLRRAISLRQVVSAAGDPAADLLALTAAGTRRHYGIDLPPEADAYRSAARAFRETYLAADPADRRTLLAESGYLVPHWPKPFGRGASAIEQLVIDEEFAGLDDWDLGITGWVVLTLIQTGTPEQIERWVKPTLATGQVWCQLFSEPSAGSDAAAVTTRGVKVEGGWLVTGQKVWTSGAHHAHLGLATVRTNPGASKHKGISAMVVDMHADGVEIRPLRQINGESHFNEVFFDEVFVPDSDVVGEVDQGWSVARTTLGNERVSIGGGLPGRFTAFRLLELAQTHGALQTWGPDVARLIAAEQALELVNLRAVARAVAGAAPGPEGNVTKLAGAEHAQRLTELAIRIAGLGVVDGSEQELVGQYLSSRASTIAGGTSEITRNVIAERILGLPRDPLNR
jgi:alkylation response protein AidB-like acyl-CoA dehydrogenase